MKDRDTKIIDRAKNGESFADIGKAFGISREAIRQILAKYNISGKRLLEKRNKNIEKAFLKTIEQGKPIDKLIEKHGGFERVKHHFYRNSNVTIFKKLKEKREEDIIRRHEEGETPLDIAKRYGLNRETVYRLLRR